jgi:phosphatidylserine decarboxylase
VRQAERLGLIRFGTRVDLFLPRGTLIRVKVGDRTQVASTVVAEWT